MSKIHPKNQSFLQQGCRKDVRLATLVFAVWAVSNTANAATQMKQETFPSPMSAVQAIVTANRNNSVQELRKILGPHSERLLFSGDPIADERGRRKFVAAYDTAHQLEGGNGDRRILVVGSHNWSLPIPIVREGKSWLFDTEEGEQEILNRRVGRNELNVIHVCLAYADAQHDFAEDRLLMGEDPEYAQKIHSTDGKKDGLYWQTDEDDGDSPLGPLMAFAEAEGYGKKALQPQTPYHGYFYKILTQQGNQALGGAKNYIVNNHMTNGFALIAFPAQYGNSGVMTFIINQDGIVYEKDLGRTTAERVKQITQYNPDPTWRLP